MMSKNTLRYGVFAFLGLLFVLLQIRNQERAKIKAGNVQGHDAESGSATLVEEEDAQAIAAKSIASIPTRTTNYHADSFKMSCGRQATSDEYQLVGDIREYFGRYPESINHVVFTVSTLAALPALKIQVESLKSNAPGLIKHFVIFCVGHETCQECKNIHATANACIQDRYLESILQGEAGADSMAFGDATTHVDKVYVDIIWRKPELMRAVFIAGAQKVTVVDTDGAWFSEPPEDLGEYPVASSEFEQVGNIRVDENYCAMSQIYRGAPLILNSGTVQMKNNIYGKSLLDEWLATRATRPEGLCEGTGVSHVSRESVMLDQDGLNKAACFKGKPYSGQVRALSSNQVLLNSVHFLIRPLAWFSICKPWFFHSTNCGGNNLKPSCMTKNLQRRLDQCGPASQQTKAADLSRTPVAAKSNALGQIDLAH
jgi:hypothetical protein